MKTLITTALIIAFTIVKTFSQNLPGVWHGNAKTPDNKEILFVFLFEKNQDGYVSKMAIPTFDVMDFKSKATTFKNGKLSIDGSNVGMKYEGIYTANC